MPRHLRYGGPHGRDTRRWAIGVVVSSVSNRLEAALVTAVGRGLDLQAELVGLKVVRGCAELAGLFGRISSGAPVRPNRTWNRTVVRESERSPSTNERASGSDHICSTERLSSTTSTAS